MKLICNRFVLFALSVFLVSISKAQISGTVFRDFNFNGIKENSGTYNEPFVPGITVKAYDNMGALVGTQSTNSSGAYSFTGLTLPVRIEFTEMLNDDFTSPSGASNLSSVQFYTSPSSSANFGINYPQHYTSSTNPYYVVSQFEANRPPSNEPLATAMLKQQYNTRGSSNYAPSIAHASAIGATWSVVYDRKRSLIYTSTFAKRHSSMKDNDSDGKEDLGAIYSMTPSGSPSLWLDLSSLGIDFGTALLPSVTARALPTTLIGPSHDAAMFALVGKIGIGGITLSDDYTKMYVMNLYDKKIYTIDIASKTLLAVSSVIPNSCSSGESRPFALKYHRGKVYIGAICDASTSGNFNDLTATIFTYNGISFTNIFSYPLNYVKGYVFKDIDDNNFNSQQEEWGKQWNAWSDVMPSPLFTSNLTSPASQVVLNPQPMLVDLEFDYDESLIMVFNDRFGHQAGQVNYGTNVNNTTSFYTGLAAGDILRASFSSGTYILENDGLVGGLSGNTTNLNGPGGGEFYHGDHDLYNYHAENVIGGSLIYPGKGEVAAIVTDPIGYWAGGVYYFDNVNGNVLNGTDNYQLYPSTLDNSKFGKVNGLGDLELITDAASIEIGNRVWFDSDGDGIQDAGETGIAGVIVELYQGGTLVGTTTTDAAGNYYFNNSNVNLNGASGILPSTAYCVRVPNVIGGSKQGALGSNTLSLANSDASSNGDERDNDGSLNGNNADVCFTTGISGANNHSYDFGFKQCFVDAGNTIYLNCTTPSGTIGTPAVSGDTYSWSPATGLNDATLAQPTASPMTTTTYTLTVNGSCSDTVTVFADKIAPTADAGSTQNLDCATTSATIGTTAIAGNTYSWSPASGLSATNIAQPTASPTATTTYTVMVTGSNGCTATSTVMVNVNTTAPTVTISGGTIVCNGSTTTLTASGANTYVWSNLDNSAQSVVGVGTYTVTGTASNGCTSTSSVSVINQQGSVGNYVWLDTNRNGFNDEPSSAGINGVTVELWSATTNTLISTTMTANDGSGNPGYYNFAICSNGDYKVKFPLLNGTNTLTSQTSTAGTDNNSDANTLDGYSPTFTIDITGSGVAKDNTTIDAGYKMPFACLGNYVWNDENQDGIQNNGEVGVSGVTTTLYNATTNVILATVTTDAYGFYQFCGLNPGDYKVGFSLPTNYVFTGSNTGGDDTIDSDPSNITGLTATITLASGDSNMTVDAGIYQPQPTTATVGDRVWFDANNNGTQDPGEQGVSGVTVTLYNCANPTTPIATTITGANGNYIFENVAPGSYSVSFTAPIGTTFTSQTGSVSTTNNSDADATGKTACFPVLAGDQITYVDAGIIPQTVGNASIGDKVWNDANQDGIQDPTETGVAGVTVTLYDASGTTVISTTTTDGLGNYGFNDLAPGCYVVGFGLPVGYTRTLQGAGSDTTKNSDANTTTGLTSQVCVSAGQNNSTIDAGIYNASNTNSLGDKVWYDVDKDGIQDVGEYGYPGVVVTLYDCTTNTIQAITTTDANGNYLFDGIANGSYYVGFGFIPGFQFTGANADVAGILGGNNSDANPSSGLTACVSLTGNTNITTVDAGIYPGNTRNATSSLGDIVWLDANSNGLQDNGETGVPGVTATLINATTNAVLATTITDGLGNYIFTNLDGGNYKVEFSNIPVGYTFTTQGSNIEDEDNSDANPATGKTNSIPLGVGEDKMSVDAGIVAPLGTVCLGDYVWIDLDNDGVQEANEPAVPGVTVKLYDNNTNTVLQVATTNREGNYLFCGLTTGNTYSVGFENLPAGFTFTTSSGALSTPDNSDANPVTGRTTTVTLGATNDLTLDAGIYSPTTAVVGNYVWYDEDADGIQDPTEAPIPGVLVTLYDNTNTPVASAVTDANGGYLFTNVAPGTYTIGFEGYPSTLIPTTKGANPSADDDSNIDPITGRTDAFIVTPGSSNLTLDAGYKANPIAGLGNYVWYDINENGLQDASEPGISGVIVSLFESDGSTLLATAITDGNGAYSFPNLPAGSYVVGFTAPAGYTRTKSLGGLNDALNSDVDVTNKTAVVTLIAGEYNPNIDAGFYIGVPLPAKVLQATLANFVNASLCTVNWFTKDEQNTLSFEIERGVDNQHFEKVGTHVAAGNSFGQTDYSFNDDLSSLSEYTTLYYRIKLVDIDGKISYSNVINVTKPVNDEPILVYPNPFVDALTIELMSDVSDLMQLTLSDMNGRVISVLQKEVTEGMNKITIQNLGSLSSGNYYLKITSLENGYSYLRQLSK